MTARWRSTENSRVTLMLRPSPIMVAMAASPASVPGIFT